MRTVARIVVEDKSQAAEARRVAVALAGRLGFSESKIGEVALVVTEAATNLAKHASRGELLLSTFDFNRTPRLEMLALDKGPGMDLNHSLIDGYSTAGTRGEGLGAIQRMSAEFDGYSNNAGTVIFAAFHESKSAPVQSRLTSGSARVAMKGEVLCGDDWGMVMDESGSARIMVADGLGHGPFAADASRAAIDTFESQPFTSVQDTIRATHGALRGTRGAAIAVCELDLPNQVIRYSGLGNIVSTIVTPRKLQQMVSMNGTAGYEAPRISKFDYPWSADSILVMQSDGLLTQWNIDKHPGLLSRHPSVIAGLLYRDFNRGRDDATVVIVKNS